MQIDFTEIIETRDLIERAMSTLNGKEKDVISALIRGERLTDVAAKMGCKRQNINYYRECAIKKMRCSLNESISCI